MSRGITVLSFDSGVAKAGRVLQINPSNPTLIGEKQIEMAHKTLGGKGEIAILSATAQATNQNTWIKVMKTVLAKPEYSGLQLVDVVYGDDQSDKSYREAIGLLRKHPKLGAIIAPTTVGITAAAKAVTDQKLVGKVFVTGLGLPSEMAGHVHSGAVDTFAIWNPIDLGYTAVYSAYQVLTKKATGKPGTTLTAGRMGALEIDTNGDVAMAKPYVFDKANVDQFAKFF
jgi:rhamnose transport system substrate-binding protein